MNKEKEIPCYLSDYWYINVKLSITEETLQRVIVSRARNEIEEIELITTHGSMLTRIEYLHLIH